MIKFCFMSKNTRFWGPRWIRAWTYKSEQSAFDSIRFLLGDDPETLEIAIIKLIRDDGWVSLYDPSVFRPVRPGMDAGGSDAPIISPR